MKNNFALKLMKKEKKFLTLEKQTAGQFLLKIKIMN